MNEERAIILDFLPHGKSSSFKSEPLALVVGTAFFTLLEVVPKPNTELKPLEEAYIGKEARDKIDHIKQRTTYDNLTSNARAELDKAIDKIIGMNETKFLQFFNSAGPISLKRHRLELLPGVGKHHMELILRERTTKLFDSFTELESRIKFPTSVTSILRRRILNELEGKEKHFLFVRPPQIEDERHVRRFR
ncbi:MAG: DUF655 domain-containing protein [Candidatus Diapherotrites archaeon]|nr:DUF655 domain-containing protein [Candidatus Diapherotrites archaeon]MDZ4256493.1 DUF655 domain-containing protein [archaeon]